MVITKWWAFDKRSRILIKAKWDTLSKHNPSSETQGQLARAGRSKSGKNWRRDKSFIYFVPTRLTGPGSPRMNITGSEKH